MQSAMLSLIGQRPGLPDLPGSQQQNPESASGDFLSLLGASEQEGRGTPGARLYPGEFQSIRPLPETDVSLLTLTSPRQPSLQPISQPEPNVAFSMPPQTERVRDSQSYFYAANMDRELSDRNVQSQSPASEKASSGSETRDLAESRRRDEIRQQEKDAQSRRQEAEDRKDRADASKKESESRPTEGTDKSERKDVAVAEEKSARNKESGESSKEKKEVSEKDAWGRIAGTAEKNARTETVEKSEKAQKTEKSDASDALLQAIMNRVAETADRKTGQSEKKNDNAQSEASNLWKKVALESPEGQGLSLKDFKDKIQAHPEFEKALKALKDGKDLESFVKRIVEDLTSGDKNLKELKELARNGFKNVSESTLAGSVRLPAENGAGKEKWTVEGPVLSSEVKIKTEEKGFSSGKGNEGQGKGSDSPNPQFRMDNLAAMDARTRTATETKEATPFDRKQFQKMVEQARVRMGSDGRSTAQIRMNPEHLGRLQLDLVMKDNVVSGRVIVDNQQAFKMLRDDIEHLRQELARHGIQLENLSVKTREAFQSQSQMSQDQRPGMNFQNQQSNQWDGSGNGSENLENTEKYVKEGPTWEERSISDVSESLLVATSPDAGRIDLSV